MSLPLSTPVNYAQTEPPQAPLELADPARASVAPSRSVELVEKIQQRHPAGFEELYGLVKNFTFFLMRQLGTEELQDKVHDVFVTVTQAILSGKLRDPERLIPFLTTVTRFYTYNQIER